MSGFLEDIVTDEIVQMYNQQADQNAFLKADVAMQDAMQAAEQSGMAIAAGPMDESYSPPPSKPKYTEDQLTMMPDWIEVSKRMYRVMEGYEFIGSDKQAAAYGLDLVSEFNWNVTGPAGFPGDAGISSPGMIGQVWKIVNSGGYTDLYGNLVTRENNANDFLFLLDTYADTKIEGATIKRSLRALFGAPETYGSIGGGLAAPFIKGAAMKTSSMTARQMLMLAAKTAGYTTQLAKRKPATSGAVAGAAYADLYEGGQMILETAAGAPPSLQEAVTRALTTTAAGATIGGTLGKLLGSTVEEAGPAVRQGVVSAGEAAEARMAERGPLASRVMSGVDPMEVIDPALAAAGKMAQDTKTVSPGTAIPAKTTAPTADEIAAAQVDQRQTAESVSQRLNVTVPESERVAGGTYVVGAPGGGRWTDLPQEKLNERGPGFAGTDADLERMWEESLNEVSQAARDAVERTGATWKAFPAASWDKAMRLPNRSQLWYELSGESFVDRLPDLTLDEHMMFVDLVGATSARAAPGPNLERAVAVLSQKLRGVPVDVDLTTESTVAAALQREGVGVSSDLANKTGMFSDTLALTGGLPVRYPISVNDVWVAKAYGISDSALSGNQALHEVFGKYMNKLRDFTNAQGGEGIRHESWHKQARQWVEMRAADEGIDTSKVVSVEGNDYAGEFGKLIEKLEAAGIDVPGGVLTKDILMDPRVADALRPTTPSYRSAPKATVEFGTLLTPSGEKAANIFAAAREAGDTLTQSEYLGTLTSGMYASARGKTLWEKTVRLATGQSQMVTRISAPTKADPFAYSGTFEGAAAPNIRIPLKDMSPDQIAYFNAMAGKGLKQKAMAAAEIRNIGLNDALPEGYIETSTLYFPWNETVPEELIIGVSKALGDGFEVSASKTPGGLKIDINPRFTDDGVEGPSADAIDSATDFLENEFGAKNVKEFRAAYKSEYGQNYVEDDGTGSVYDGIIEATLKGWEDEAAQAIQSIAGTRATPDAITAFLRGEADDIAITGDGVTSAQKTSIRSRASTVRKRLRARIDSHNEALKEWGQIGADLNAKMTAAIPKWERRAAARAKKQGGGE